MKSWLFPTACIGLTTVASLMGAIDVKARLASQSITPIVTPSPQPKVTPRSIMRPTIEEFRVIGTEPFWGMTISRQGIVYTTPDAKSQTFPYVAPISAQGRPIDLVRVYRLQGQPNQMLVIKKGACSDGMSDRRYSYSAILILGNTVREGCADKK